MTLWRLPLSLASPGGARGRLSILIFHRVPPTPDPLFPDLLDAAAFEQRLRWIARDFNILPLADAVERLYDGRLPSRALCITFDDGYADNATVAAPILDRLRLTATFFVSTGFLDGRCMWNDRIVEAVRATARPEFDLSSFRLGRYPTSTLEAKRASVPRMLLDVKHLAPGAREHAVDAIVALAGAGEPPGLMMRPDQVRRLHASGMSIGAHTVHHPILACTPSTVSRAEMADSKRELEDIIGAPLRLFAYPNGVPRQDYTREHVAMAQDCGFAAAVSTAWGAASRLSDRFQLPRFTPWDAGAARYKARLVHNLLRRDVVRA